MSVRPSVSAVVLNYNGRPHLNACLESLRGQTRPPVSIHVVDNGSGDGSGQDAKEKFPEIHLHSLSSNLGFAAGQNAGARFAPADCIALLTQDVRVPPRFIEDLSDALQADPQAAVAGPAVNNGNLDMALYPGTGTMSLTGTVIQNVFTDPLATFGAAGCSLIFRPGLLGEPFDPDYWLFHEDVYLAWRAWLKGYRVLRVPGVVVEHVGGASVSALGETNRFFLERNRLINFYVFFSGWTRLRIRPLLGLAQWLEFFADRRAGRSREPIRRARRWIRGNWALIRTKRGRLQSERKVPDREIIRLMTCRITNGDGLAGRVLNALAWGWCAAAGLGTHEFRRARVRA